MASLKKPASCDKCGRADLIYKIKVMSTAPNYEGYVCGHCVTDVGVAPFPASFLIFRPKRNPDQCRDCGAKRGTVPFKAGKNQCTSCANVAHNKWEAENGDHVKEHRSTPEFKKARAQSVYKAQTRSPEAWIQSLMHHICKPSMREKIKRGHTSAILIIDINTEYLIGLYQAQDGKCALSGVQMTHRRHDFTSISVDRIDSSKGYIRGNVQLVCKSFNLAKGKHPNDEMKKLLEASRRANSCIEVLERRSMVQIQVDQDCFGPFIKCINTPTQLVVLSTENGTERDTLIGLENGKIRHRGQFKPFVIQPVQSKISQNILGYFVPDGVNGLLAAIRE